MSLTMMSDLLVEQGRSKPVRLAHSLFDWGLTHP